MKNKINLSELSFRKLISIFTLIGMATLPSVGASEESEDAALKTYMQSYYWGENIEKEAKVLEKKLKGGKITKAFISKATHVAYKTNEKQEKLKALVFCYDKKDLDHGYWRYALDTKDTTYIAHVASLYKDDKHPLRGKDLQNLIKMQDLDDKSIITLLPHFPIDAATLSFFFTKHSAAVITAAVDRYKTLHPKKTIQNEELFLVALKEKNIQILKKLLEVSIPTLQTLYNALANKYPNYYYDFDCFKLLLTTYQKHYPQPRLDPGILKSFFQESYHEKAELTPMLLASFIPTATSVTSLLQNSSSKDEIILAVLEKYQQNKQRKEGELLQAFKAYIQEHKNSSYKLPIIEKLLTVVNPDKQLIQSVLAAISINDKILFALLDGYKNNKKRKEDELLQAFKAYIKEHKNSSYRLPTIEKLLTLVNPDKQLIQSVLAAISINDKILFALLDGYKNNKKRKEGELLQAFNAYIKKHKNSSYKLSTIEKLLTLVNPDKQLIQFLLTESSIDEKILLALLDGYKNNKKRKEGELSQAFNAYIKKHKNNSYKLPIIEQFLPLINPDKQLIQFLLTESSTDDKILLTLLDGYKNNKQRKEGELSQAFNAYIKKHKNNTYKLPIIKQLLTLFIPDTKIFQEVLEDITTSEELLIDFLACYQKSKNKNDKFFVPLLKSFFQKNNIEEKRVENLQKYIPFLVSLQANKELLLSLCNKKLEKIQNQKKLLEEIKGKKEITKAFLDMSCLIYVFRDQKVASKDKIHLLEIYKKEKAQNGAPQWIDLLNDFIESLTIIFDERKNNSELLHAILALVKPDNSTLQILTKYLYNIKSITLIRLLKAYHNNPQKNPAQATSYLNYILKQFIYYDKDGEDIVLEIAKIIVPNQETLGITDLRFKSFYKERTHKFYPIQKALFEQYKKQSPNPKKAEKHLVNLLKENPTNLALQDVLEEKLFVILYPSAILEFMKYEFGTKDAIWNKEKILGITKRFQQGLPKKKITKSLIEYASAISSGYTKQRIEKLKALVYLYQGHDLDHGYWDFAIDTGDIHYIVHVLTHYRDKAHPLKAEDLNQLLNRFPYYGNQAPLKTLLTHLPMNAGTLFLLAKSHSRNLVNIGINKYKKSFPGKKIQKKGIFLEVLACQEVEILEKLLEVIVPTRETFLTALDEKNYHFFFVIEKLFAAYQKVYPIRMPEEELFKKLLFTNYNKGEDNDKLITLCLTCFTPTEKVLQEAMKASPKCYPFLKTLLKGVNTKQSQQWLQDIEEKERKLLERKAAIEKKYNGSPTEEDLHFAWLDYPFARENQEKLLESYIKNQKKKKPKKGAQLLNDFINTCPQEVDRIITLLSIMPPNEETLKMLTDEPFLHLHIERPILEAYAKLDAKKKDFQKAMHLLISFIKAYQKEEKAHLNNNKIVLFDPKKASNVHPQLPYVNTVKILERKFSLLKNLLTSIPINEPSLKKLLVDENSSQKIEKILLASYQKNAHKNQKELFELLHGYIKKYRHNEQKKPTIALFVKGIASNKEALEQLLSSNYVKKNNLGEFLIATYESNLLQAFMKENSDQIKGSLHELIQELPHGKLTPEIIEKALTIQEGVWKRELKLKAMIDAYKGNLNKSILAYAVSTTDIKFIGDALSRYDAPHTLLPAKNLNTLLSRFTLRQLSSIKEHIQRFGVDEYTLFLIAKSTFNPLIVTIIDKYKIGKGRTTNSTILIEAIESDQSLHNKLQVIHKLLEVVTLDFAFFKWLLDQSLDAQIEESLLAAYKANQDKALRLKISKYFHNYLKKYSNTIESLPKIEKMLKVVTPNVETLKLTWNLTCQDAIVRSLLKAYAKVPTIKKNLAAAQEEGLLPFMKYKKENKEPLVREFIKVVVPTRNDLENLLNSAYVKDHKLGDNLTTGYQKNKTEEFMRAPVHNNLQEQLDALIQSLPYGKISKSIFDEASRLPTKNLKERKQKLNAISDKLSAVNPLLSNDEAKSKLPEIKATQKHKKKPPHVSINDIPATLPKDEIEFKTSSPIPSPLTDKDKLFNDSSIADNLLHIDKKSFLSKSANSSLPSLSNNDSNVDSPKNFDFKTTKANNLPNISTTLSHNDAPFSSPITSPHISTTLNHDDSDKDIAPSSNDKENKNKSPNISIHIPSPQSNHTTNLSPNVSPIILQPKTKNSSTKNNMKDNVQTRESFHQFLIKNGHRSSQVDHIKRQLEAISANADTLELLFANYFCDEVVKILLESYLNNPNKNEKKTRKSFHQFLINRPTAKSITQILDYIPANEDTLALLLSNKIFSTNLVDKLLKNYTANKNKDKAKARQIFHQFLEKKGNKRPEKSIIEKILQVIPPHQETLNLDMDDKVKTLVNKIYNQNNPSNISSRIINEDELSSDSSIDDDLSHREKKTFSSNPSNSLLDSLSDNDSDTNSISSSSTITEDDDSDTAPSPTVLQPKTKNSSTKNNVQTRESFHQFLIKNGYKSSKATHIRRQLKTISANADTLDILFDEDNVLCDEVKKAILKSYATNPNKNEKKARKSFHQFLIKHSFAKEIPQILDYIPANEDTLDILFDKDNFFLDEVKEAILESYASNPNKNEKKARKSFHQFLIKHPFAEEPTQILDYIPANEDTLTLLLSNKIPNTSLEDKVLKSYTANNNKDEKKGRQIFHQFLEKKGDKSPEISTIEKILQVIPPHQETLNLDMDDKVKALVNKVYNQNNRSKSSSTAMDEDEFFNDSSIDDNLLHLGKKSFLSKSANSSLRSLSDNDNNVGSPKSFDFKKKNLQVTHKDQSQTSTSNGTKKIVGIVLTFAVILSASIAAIFYLKKKPTVKASPQKSGKPENKKKEEQKKEDEKKKEEQKKEAKERVENIADFDPQEEEFEESA